jgi:hypothetical protein
VCYRLGPPSFRFVEHEVITGKNIKSQFKEVSSMKPVNAAKIKYGIWGLICGAVIAMIIGFGWGGWTTAATSEKLSADAVLASEAAICVAQFMQEPNYKERLKELGELNKWKRAEYIENGGWDKMPGQEKAAYEVARACSDGLDRLVEN